MQFEFSTATRIIFGAGKAKEIGTYAPTLGRRAMVVTGRSSARADMILEQLDKQGTEPAFKRRARLPAIGSSVSEAEASLIPARLLPPC